jgi:hypothetical protein
VATFSYQVRLISMLRMYRYERRNVSYPCFASRQANPSGIASEEFILHWARHMRICVMLRPGRRDHGDHGQVPRAVTFRPELRGR